MRKLGIDYGDSRVGIAITDPLGITAQGLETIDYKGNDKVLLRRLDEIFADKNFITPMYKLDPKTTLLPNKLIKLT